jgi:hypothetical protein
VGWTDITERTGKTLSAAAGLSTSSARNVGELGGISTFVLSCDMGSPASVISGLFTRAEVVPGADVPSFNSVEASACPLSSLDALPVPLDRLELSCSVDITAASSDPNPKMPIGGGVAAKRSRSRRADCPPPYTVCRLTLDARSPPGSPVYFQADGPKSPVVASTSQSSLSHRSGVQGVAWGGQSPEYRIQSSCSPVWRIAGSEFSVRPKTRDWDWDVGLWCREGHSDDGGRVALAGAVLSSGK